MDLVAGIGGVFLYSNNPRELAKWYNEILGLECIQSEEYSSIYKLFNYRDASDPQTERSMAWAILPSTENIKNSPRTGGINYRVFNMEDTIAHLETKGIEILKREEHAYGKFAWISDPDGNKVELFQD